MIRRNNGCDDAFQMPEEEAFAVLVKIMQQHKMRDMFKPSMAELGLCMYQLENLLQEILPDLHVHFQSQVCISQSLSYNLYIYIGHATKTGLASR